MRDKLIELLYTMLHDNVTRTLEETADYLIAHGVMFADVPDTNVGRWIPVSERLPNHGDIVLCNTVFGMDVFQWDDRSRLWVGLEASHGRLFVKHWMPLPEAPKEGE